MVTGNFIFFRRVKLVRRYVFEIAFHPIAMLVKISIFE